MKTKFSFYKSVLIALCLALLAFSVALAASGGLDTAFSGDGKIVQSFGGVSHFGTDIAVQSNGKLVAVGHKWLTNGGHDFAIARYNANGSLDTTFSGDGLQVVNVGPLTSNNPKIKVTPIDQAYGVAIQSDGKIVVVGRTCTLDFSTCYVALIRLHPGGALDTTFGDGGRVITDISKSPGNNGAYDVVMQGTKILLAGYLYTGTNYNGVVYRYNADGSLDTTFSQDGVAEVDFGGNDFFNAIALYGGKIYVAGYSRVADTVSSDFIVARIYLNGVLDKTFHYTGKVSTGIGVNDVATSLVISPLGRVLVAGYSDDRLAVVRYTAAGNLDPTFGQGGILTARNGLESPSANGITLENGKIVLSGTSDRTGKTSSRAFLLRYTSGGILDTAFGQGGMALTAWGGSDGYAAVLFKNNRLYTVGTSKTPNGLYHFILARYLP